MRICTRKQNTARMIKCIKLSICAAAVFLSAGCVDITLQSVWTDREIVIDGKDADWPQGQPKEKNVSFGACNDAESLYLCFSVTDKITKAQLMGLFKQDLFLWFDPQCKRIRRAGIKVSNDSAFMNEEMLGKMRHMKVQMFQVVGDEMMKNMSIEIMSDYFPEAPLSVAKGVDVGVGISGDGRQLTYEIRIPLKRSQGHPFAVEVVEGKPIGIGLETSPLNLEKLRKEMGLTSADASVEDTGLRGRGRKRHMLPPPTMKDFETEFMLENFRPVHVWCKVVPARNPALKKKS